MDDVTPFGRYKGRLLSQIPRGYLRWLVQQKSLRGSLRAPIKAELDHDP